MSDRLEDRLAAGAAEGDRAAFWQLFELSFPRLFDYTARLSGRADTGLAIVEAAFRRAIDTQFVLAESPSFGVRLWTLARDLLLSSDSQPPLAVLQAAPVGDPADAVWPALATLDEPDRSAFYLDSRAGLSPEEIAAICEIGPGELPARIAAASDTLRRAVGDRAVDITTVIRDAPEWPVAADLIDGVRTRLAEGWPPPAPQFWGEPVDGSATASGEPDPTTTSPPQSWGGRGGPDTTASLPTSGGPDLADPDATARWERPAATETAPAGTPLITPAPAPTSPPQSWGDPEGPPDPTFRIRPPDDEFPTERTPVLPDRGGRDGGPPGPPTGRGGCFGPLGGSLLVGLIFGLIASCAGVVFVLANGGFQSPSAARRTPAGSPVVVASPTLTPTSTATGTATRTPTVTATGTRTPTPTVSATATLSPTLTPSPIATVTLTQSATPTSSATATATSTPTPTATVTLTPTPTTVAVSPTLAPPTATAPGATATATPRFGTATAVSISPTASPGAGSLNVRPTQLTFEPAQERLVVDIGNAGRQPIGWQATTNVPWVSVALAGGILPPGDFFPLDVTVQRSPLGPGTHRAVLTITSDDGRVEVPVVVQVVR